ncbi:MAG TPA: GC-type dockerin domain-anchored protein [Phycisphaerales bacterium]|nr:GC-type dockerin domain-anchored protein [Phycisphaerales bacterium]
MRRLTRTAGIAVLLGSPVLLAGAGNRMTFHFMQIEQVIGGVAGDPAAQAVQLRMRAAGQNFVSQSRIVAYDAAGQNPVVLLDITSNVANGSGGDRVLIVSPGFDSSLTDPPLTPDFVMTSAIPESYLAAGRITFENNTGSQVLWSLAWGGDGYTGPNSGTFDNDNDGNFSPPYPGTLPSAGLDSLRFEGPFNAKSTNNADDYTADGPAVLTNNARQSFTLVGPDECEADFNGDGNVNTQDVLAFLNAWTAGDSSADFNGDGNINTQDVLAFLNAWTAGC